MKKAQLQVKRTINASADKVWHVMGDDFVHVSKWANGVLTSVPNPNSEQKFSDAPTGGRVCQVKGFGEIVEDILVSIT